MPHNGPPTWGGCVPPAGGWRTFLRHGRIYVVYVRFALQCLLGQVNYPGIVTK